jgi:hypothetical protein
MAKCGQQAASATHDPSACAQQAGACPGGSGSSDSCSGAIGIGDCVTNSDCSADEHCFSDGKCYSNRSGEKCIVDTDCGSGNHCTDRACCVSGATGNSCVSDSQCAHGCGLDGKCK